MVALVIPAPTLETLQTFNRKKSGKIRRKASEAAMVYSRNGNWERCRWAMHMDGVTFILQEGSALLETALDEPALILVVADMD